MALEALQFLAALSTSLFAGAAIYVNVAEHPARLALDTRSAALQWASSYKRAAWMQASLAIASFVAGLSAWLLSGGILWLAAALLIGAVVPITFAVILPINRLLLAAGRDLGSAETRQLLELWGKLHAIRSALSAAAAVLMLWDLTR
ncbi:MAG TPA: DUF1772 domain-containing protein [Methyloceanibacter sp.]|nr:DUF1772 domain-containing protein [Methyloceanibacter sp.]